MEAALTSRVPTWLPRKYCDEAVEEQVTNVDVIDRHLRACLLVGDIERGSSTMNACSLSNLLQGHVFGCAVLAGTCLASIDIYKQNPINYYCKVQSTYRKGANPSL